VKVILVSHEHFDHVGAEAALNKRLAEEKK